MISSQFSEPRPDGQPRPWSSGIGKLSNLSSQYCLTPNYFTSIIFGDREEEEPKQGISREDRMRKLEAKQREKEGRAPLGADTDKPQAPPVASPGTSNRSGQDTNGTRKYPQFRDKRFSC
jgi:hypothetical protein